MFIGRNVSTIIAVYFFRPIIPRLTLYVSVNQKQVYNAIYMPVLNCSELRLRLLLVMQLSSSKLKDVFLWGPGGIHILVTDEVRSHATTYSTYLRYNEF